MDEARGARGRRILLGEGSPGEGIEAIGLSGGIEGTVARLGGLRGLAGIEAGGLPAWARGEVARLLRACREALEPGGTLRIAAPAGEDAARDLARLAGWVGLADRGGDAPRPEAGAGRVLELERARREAPGDPLVSVLIPAYKPRFFREALESALAQGWPSLEVVVSDDSGGDEIGAAVRAVAGGDPRVRYHRNPTNVGGRRNYLRCLELARGEYVKFLNDDDVLLPGCVERMARCLQAVPGATLVTSHRGTVDATGARLGEGPATRRVVLEDALVDGVSAVDLMIESSTNFIGEPSTTMFRRADVADASPHLMSFAGEAAVANGDTHVWASLLSKGHLVYLASTLSLFRVHDAQAQRDPAFRERGIRGWETLGERARDLGFRSSGPVPRLVWTPLGARPWWGDPARRAWGEAVAARGSSGEGAAWEAVAALAPGDVQIACDHARARFGAGDALGAARAAAEATRLDPTYLPAWAWLGTALRRAGRDREGRAAVQRGIALGLPWLLWGDRGWTGGPARLDTPWSLWVQTGGWRARISLEIGLAESPAAGPARLPTAVEGSAGPTLELRTPGEGARIALDVPEGRDQTALRIGPCGGSFTLGRLDVDLLPPAGGPS